MGVVLNTIVTVAAGIGAALAVYWVLDRLVALMPTKTAEKLRPFVYILPAYAAITLYLIYPTVLTAIYAFKDAASQNWVGFDNFDYLFHQQDFKDALVNTLLWIAIVPAATVILGLVIATLSDRLSGGGEKLAKTIIFMPMAISMVGASVIWRFVYDYDAQREAQGKPQIGLQNAAWDKIGGNPVDWLGQTSFHINSMWLMVILLWAQIGFSMVLLSAAIKGVPDDTLEAARIDGASEGQIFFRVVVPQIKGTIITVFVTVTITVMKVFDVVYVITNGSRKTNVLANEFFNQFLTNFDTGHASAIVLILVVLVIPFMIYQVRHFRAEEANA